MSYQSNELIIGDARIIFRNFSGRESEYNASGDRNFSVVIDDPESAQQLIEDGWNVKSRPPRSEDEEALYHLPVSVSFSNFPPEVHVLIGRTMTELNEETIHRLDSLYVETVDLVIRPYNWEVGGRKGTKAYLKTMYATIKQNPFADKYARLLGEDDSAEDEYLPF